MVAQESEELLQRKLHTVLDLSNQGDGWQGRM